MTLLALLTGFLVGCTAQPVELGPQDAAIDHSVLVDAATPCVLNDWPKYVPTDGSCACPSGTDAGTCPGDAPCVDCQCALDCNPKVEFACPLGYVCSGARGDPGPLYCLPHPCRGMVCPAGQACSGQTGVCTALCPPPDGATVDAAD